MRRSLKLSVVCKYCGHVNQDRLYCENCSIPLYDDMLKDWLLQKYFENLILNAEFMEEVVRACKDATVGEVKVDYLIGYKDGSKTLLITKWSDEAVRKVIEYNKEKREKIKVVFLSVGSVIPNVDDNLVLEASKFNIEVEYFVVLKCKDGKLEIVKSNNRNELHSKHCIGNNFSVNESS